MADFANSIPAPAVQALPTAKPLPFLTSAFSRRRAIFGAVDMRQILDLDEAVAADLSPAERRGLVALSLAVEAKAARAVGIEPRSTEAEALLATVLP